MSAWLPNYPGLGHENHATPRRAPRNQQPDNAPPVPEGNPTAPTQDTPSQKPVIESVTFGLSTWPENAASLRAYQWPSDPGRKRMDLVYKIRFGTMTYEFILYWHPPPGLQVPRDRRAEQRYLQHFENLWRASPNPETSPSFLPVLKQLDEIILQSMYRNNVTLDRPMTNTEPWVCQIVDQDTGPLLYALQRTELWADHRPREVLAVAVYTDSGIHVTHENRPGL
ncbi:hypothetical protein CORC01_06904 [Colletotrichum orchidophilum]|uniref:Uncharacterized protein n=1 Tax=Colletotrichum orchidophilum TaxID=1209926 RepID=A0A1G4B8C3_9PEZI|nr:uncharacterized protein CORC01_06904 [Colletotrichum orchidophilum]OHE97699.1 hypothetical protein CORC01_06904 [Colletotrichum orchidophilum]